MIAGCFHIEMQHKCNLDQFKRDFNIADTKHADFLIGNNYIFAHIPDGLSALDKESGKFYHENQKICGVFQGHIFNKGELTSALNTPNNHFSYSIVNEIFKLNKTNLFKKISGSFSVAAVNKNTDEIYLIRDHFGIESLFYLIDGESLYFSSSLKMLANAKVYQKKLNEQALYRYLLFNYNAGLDTFYKNIHKVNPGHFLKYSNGQLTKERYWYLSYENTDKRPLEEIKNELLENLQNAVTIRLDKNSSGLGVFLSGGMDSSSVVGLAAPQMENPIHTFSFRCAGKDVDESYYAQVMSNYYNTNHHLIEYPPEKVGELEALVSCMEEPFSDIGIEIASFILGEEARGKAEIILTGDGGDELFAGHPVYLADKISGKYDWLPEVFKHGFYKLSQILPDTENKKSLSVKIKRFLYSAQFPQSLYSNRWRMYYTPVEIKALLQTSVLHDFDSVDPLDYYYSVYNEADGDTYLNKSLYGDYYSVVDFYLRRMAVLRNFGMEIRFPLLDIQLVEFAAQIPLHLKITKSLEPKYIQHITMDGILPDEIVHRKDKLGHSVPLKNWMRDNEFVKHYIYNFINKDKINRRGFFNADFVENMIEEHSAKKNNHSHRLWSLMVLEMWLEENFQS